MKRFSSEKFDGAIWHTYETTSGFFFLTSQGREAFAAGGLSRVLRQYAEEAKRTDDDTRPFTVRRFLAQGGNANVFSLGSYPFVIKERKTEGDDLFAGLSRMDTLVNSVEKHAPRWIDVPAHLGIFALRKSPQQQYLLMQKIDNGVSVGDLLKFPGGPTDARELHLYQDAKNIFDVTPELIEEVTERYDAAKLILREALLREHQDPTHFLPDFDGNPDNILVQKLDTPVAGSSIKYWVIDQ